MSKTLFKTKSNEGHVFKVLTELLQQNLKICCYKLGEEGLILRMMDNLKRVLFDINLNSDKFDSYKFNLSGSITVGLNLGHFYKMLKSIKKKDTVELFISDEDITKFGIKVTPKDNSRTTTSYITIQNVQNIEIEVPLINTKPIVIPSNEYQKMMKDMMNIGNKIEIQTTENTIKFRCIADGIYSREVMFGNPDDDDSDDILYK